MVHRNPGPPNMSAPPLQAVDVTYPTPRRFLEVQQPA
jgi:hypothetical protein